VINRFGKLLIDEQHTGTYNNNNDYDRRRDGNDRDRDNRDKNDYGGRFGQPMHDRQFYTVMQAVRREGSDRGRVSLANRILNDNYVSASQVKDIVQLFSHENSKLDFAKNAYAKTVDRQNYFMIFDCFSFGRSKEELANHMRNNR